MVFVYKAAVSIVLAIKKNIIMNIKKYMTVLFCLTIGLISQEILAQEKIITLEDVKTMALENNNNIKRAQQNIEAAKAAKASVYASDKPSISASVMGLYFAKPINNILLPEYSANASLGLTQVLYAGGKINNAKKATSSLVELQNSQKVLTTSEVLLNAETAYWQIVSVNEKIVLAKEYNKLLKSLLNDLSNSYTAGLIYKNDLLRVQVQVNESELNIIKANDGLTMAKLNLAQITGMKDSNFAVADKSSNDITTELLANISEVSEKRPEIQMLKKAVEAQEAQGKILEGDRRPTVALSANGIYANGKKINFSDGSNDFTSFYGLISVNIPILDWGNKKQKVKEQEFKTEAQKLDLIETKQLVALEIQNNYLLLQQSIQRIELSKKSLQQADENLKLNNDRFKAGTVIGKDVLEAQVIWQQAYSNTIDAKVEYKINEAKYRKAIGELK
ncbi:MAG: TolC family protein [Bacteroidia bacterium]